MIIKVKDLLGTSFRDEEGIIIRNVINSNLNDNIDLDFEGIDRVSTTFLSCLFNDLIYRNGRDNIISKINVKNLSNTTDYSRVVMGTTFQ